MTTGAFALQERLFTTLNSDNTLTSTLGAAVYDEVPENSSYPYVNIGADAQNEYDTKDLNGSDVTINIDVWSQYKGSKEAKNIMDRVHTLLHDTSLTVTGFNLVNLRFQSSGVLRDPDGITRHGVMRFRAVMLGTA